MTPLLLQLHAIRALVDSLILVEEQAPGNVPPIMEPGSCPHCGAGPDRQVDTSRLDGTKQKRCAACGQEWTL